jgi:hypothetical protein
MSRYFRGLAQRSGLLAPFSGRAAASSAPADIVEQDTVQTVDAPTAVASRSSMPAAPAAPVVFTEPSLSVPVPGRTPAPPSAPVSMPTPAAPAPVHTVTEIFSEAPPAQVDVPAQRVIAQAPPSSAPTSMPTPAAPARISDVQEVSTFVTRDGSSPVSPTIAPTPSSTRTTPPNVASTTAPRYETHAYAAPETDRETFADTHSFAESNGTLASPKKSEAAAPASIDVRIGAIKLDIHQAAPPRPIAAAPTARAEARRESPRFAPRRYYLSGW